MPKKSAGKKTVSEKKPAGGKGEKQGQQKKKAGAVKPRLLTPQEIIDYYREHHQLPPELQRRAENKQKNE